MFKFLQIFSPYANPFEKKLDYFLRKITSKSNQPKTQKKLLNLMQENLAMLTLWLEKKSKNYKKLSKKYRKQRYENLFLLEDLFQKYKPSEPFPENVFRKFKVTFDAEKKEKIKYLWKIMKFCETYFEYRASSSFDKLLVDIRAEKMVGDCNQITTFYAHLYALKYPITDLEIRLFDDHVALHFQKIDIEATKGVFVKHKKRGDILPIVEIVSTNLLDVADFTEKQNKITPQTLLKNSQLAFLLSSLKKVVQHNLDVALQKIAIKYAQEKKFKEAELFLEKICNTEMKLKTRGVYADAVTYFVQKLKFSKARFFAKKLQDKRVDDFVLQNEVKYFLMKKNFAKARRSANLLGKQNFIKMIAHNEYANLTKNLQNVKSIADAKRKKTTYEKLLKLAKESGKKELEHFPKAVLEKLKKN